MEISVTIFSWFSDFALYLEDYLFEHNKFVMGQYDLIFDFEIKVDHELSPFT